MDLSRSTTSAASLIWTGRDAGRWRHRSWKTKPDLQVPRGQGLYHRYNAVLKRVLGNKG
jgi:hypothetical protein